MQTSEIPISSVSRTCLEVACTFYRAVQEDDKSPQKILPALHDGEEGGACFKRDAIYMYTFKIFLSRIFQMLVTQS